MLFSVRKMNKGVTSSIRIVFGNKLGLREQYESRATFMNALQIALLSRPKLIMRTDYAKTLFHLNIIFPCF